MNFLLDIFVRTLSDIVNYYCKVPQDIEAEYCIIIIKTPSGIDQNQIHEISSLNSNIRTLIYE